MYNKNMKVGVNSLYYFFFFSFLFNSDSKLQVEFVNQQSQRSFCQITKGHSKQT